MITGGITTLYVADIDRSIAFYTHTLRLHLRRRAGATWAEVEAGAQVIGLHRLDDDTVAEPPNAAIKLGFHLDRPLDDVVEELAARGVNVEGPLEDGGPVRLAFLKDPDGMPLYLYEFVETTAPIDAG